MTTGSTGKGGRAGRLHRLGRLYRTVRHLRPRQIVFRLVRRGPAARLEKRILGPRWRRFSRCMEGVTRTVVDTPTGQNPFAAAPNPPAILAREGLSVDGVPAPVDPGEWIEAGHSRFRLYRLHANLFLAHPETDGAAAVAFLGRYIALLAGEDEAGRADAFQVAWEPHPLSLRIISWVQCAAAAAARGWELPRRFPAALFCQARVLSRRVEYETDGNHLIDNAAALVLAARLLGTWGAPDAGVLYLRGVRLLLRELPRQLLPTGFHDERSPMYHNLMTEKVLDVLAVLDPDKRSESRLIGYAREMVRRAGFFGDVQPALNDTFPGMGPAAEDLNRYAAALGISSGDGGSPDVAALSAVAPRRFAPALYNVIRGHFRVLFDADAVGPDHVPGHAHADTLQILLWYDGVPTLVDTGTSTYDPGPRREYERSTAAHNTVAVGGGDSSEVWGAFRVGRRALVIENRTLVDTPREWKAEAAHDGFRWRGAIHRRAVSLTPERIVVTDRVIPAGGAGASRRAASGPLAPGSGGSSPATPNRAFWHVAPEVALTVRKISARRVALNGLECEFRGATKFYIKKSEIAAGFEKRVESVTIVVEFESELESIIEPGH